MHMCPGYAHPVFTGAPPQASESFYDRNTNGFMVIIMMMKMKTVTAAAAAAAAASALYTFYSVQNALMCWSCKSAQYALYTSYFVQSAVHGVD